MKECYERETEKLKNIIPDFYCLDNIEIQKEQSLSVPPLFILVIILSIPLAIFTSIYEDNSGITEKKEYVLDSQSYQTQYMKLEKNKTYEIKLISAFCIEERFTKLQSALGHNNIATTQFYARSTQDMKKSKKEMVTFDNSKKGSE